MVFRWPGWLLQGAKDKNSFSECFRIGQQALCVSIFSSLALLSPKQHDFSKQVEYPCLVLDQPPKCGNPAKCRVVCGDCHLSFAWKDDPVLLQRSLLTPLPTIKGSLAPTYPPPPQGTLPEVGFTYFESSRFHQQHYHSQVTVSLHLTLEPVARVKSGPEVPEATASWGGPWEEGSLGWLWAVAALTVAGAVTGGGAGAGQRGLGAALRARRAGGYC